MKRSRFAALAIVVVTSVAVAGCGASSGASDGATTLRVTDIYSLEHSIGKNGIQPYMDAVEKRTEGRVKFDYYPSEQLMAGEDVAEGLSSGAADVANVLYLESANPLMYVPQLPGLFSDDQVEPASQAFMDFATSNEAVTGKFEELGMKPLFCFTVTNYQIQFPQAGVDSLEDLRGQQIRAAGSVLPFSIEALDAASVDVDITEAYDAFNRGVIDGVALSIPSVKAYGFQDILKSVVTNLDLGGFPVCYAISQESWDSLSSQDQEVLRSEGEKIVGSVSAALHDELEQDLQKFERMGIQLNEIDEAQRDEMLAGVEDRWVQSLVDDGVPQDQATASVAEWKELLEAELQE